MSAPTEVCLGSLFEWFSKMAEDPGTYVSSDNRAERTVGMLNKTSNTRYSLPLSVATARFKWGTVDPYLPQRLFSSPSSRRVMASLLSMGVDFCKVQTVADPSGERCSPVETWISKLMHLPGKYIVSDDPKRRVMAFTHTTTETRYVVPLTSVMQRSHWGSLDQRLFSGLIRTPNNRAVMAALLSFGVDIRKISIPGGGVLRDLTEAPDLWEEGLRVPLHPSPPSDSTVLNSIRGGISAALLRAVNRHLPLATETGRDLAITEAIERALTPT